jgi:hypothetical protein
MRALLPAILLAALAPPAGAAVKPGLEGAQELFRKNRWEEARAHLRAQWGSLAPKDRGAATFLIGRSYVREAEFYRALGRVGLEVGLDYVGELSSVRANRNVVWTALFTGLYQLEAGRDREAERTLLAAGTRPTLPAEWKASARLRRAVALHRLGRAREATPALAETSPEGRYWRLIATGIAEAPAAPAPPKTRRERLMAAAVLFRSGRPADAEALLTGLTMDSPDVEEKPDPKKVLRFHDPALVTAWERICWERAVTTLRPLTAGPAGVERSLAGYYLGLALFQLGARSQVAQTLAAADDSFLGAELTPSVRLLVGAASWKGAPPAAQAAPLWDLTRAQPEAVLLWDELAGGALPKADPLAAKLDQRLRELLQSAPERPSGALVGRWALARLRRGDDPASVVAILGEHRDDANKNKLEWNDPLLLLALVAGNYRDQEYAQALETLFELSKTLPGLRGLQWNLQGVYAARQKAGGEARISQ